MFGRLIKKVRKKTFKRPKDSLYLKHKEAARIVINERLAYFAPLCGVTYKRVSIRNQKRRWGSCSSLGNLNFSYRVAALPPELRDYVIVHELCHLRELNHSKAFWALVEEVLPDYKERDLALRKTSANTKTVLG
jgi:predicted metal-dependent hydrolase